MKLLRQLFAAIFGLILVAGAAAMFHFWQADGFICFLLGGAGVSLIGFAFGKDINTWF